MKRKNRVLMARQLPLHLMLLVPCALVFVYSYLPMSGLYMAFVKYVPTLDGFFPSLVKSKFVGLSTFRFLFILPDTKRVFFNTLFIATMKIVADLVFPVAFALLLNEVRTGWFKKTVQTITYIPNFLSWVILSGILLDVFSPRDGIVNQVLGHFGIQPIYFFGNPKIFPFMMVATEVWKSIGFNTIVVLAAITGIDPALYEAAYIDGAGRLKQARHITVPSVMPIVTLLAILSLGNILNAGFDQIFNFYSPSVYSSGDIVDTFVYRVGLLDGDFSRATAVGLLKSAVSLIMISVSYWIANKFSNYRVF